MVLVLILLTAYIDIYCGRNQKPVPPIPEHSFDEDFWIAFGPVVNFNVYGSIKTEYTMYGDDIEKVEKSIRQRPITIDWMLRLGIFGVPLYLKYSNDNVLKDGGVKFRSLSFGLYM